jgi:hypothetical protein
MKPAYYAILPAEVRYDKSLSPMARILFAELTALAQKEGYAYPSNKYLSELFEVTTRAIRGWMEELERAGHIERGEVDLRRVVWINAGKKVPGGRKEFSTGVGKKVPGGEEKIFPLNNTSTNTTRINKEGASARLPFQSDFFLEAWEKWRRLKKGGWYKNVEQEELALAKLVKLARGREDFAVEIIEHSAANTYQGLFAPDHIKNQKHAPDRAAEQRAAFVRTFEGRF